MKLKCTWPGIPTRFWFTKYDTQTKTHIARVYIPLSLPTTLSLKLLAYLEIFTQIHYGEQIKISHSTFVKMEVTRDKGCVNVSLHSVVKTYLRYFYLTSSLQK